MITRTALSALQRIAQGLPAFKTMVPKRIPIIAKRRREAIVELIRLRYIKTTKTGPVITSTGKFALAEINASNRKRGDIPIAAERYGYKLSTMNSRFQDLKEPLRYE